MEVWIGNNSNFSKAYSKGKCALDRALNDISMKKKVIANLIAKHAQELEFRKFKDL